MHRTQRCARRTCANVSLRYPPFDYSEIYRKFNGGIIGSEKKHIKIRTRKQNFHGIVPAILGGILFTCFSPPQLRNDPKKKKQIFGTPPSPGTIFQICLCLCVFSFPEILKEINATLRKLTGGPATKRGTKNASIV